MLDVNYDPKKNTDEFREKVRSILRSRYGYADIVAVEEITLEFIHGMHTYGKSINNYLRESFGIPKKSED